MQSHPALLPQRRRHALAWSLRILASLLAVLIAGLPAASIGAEVRVMISGGYASTLISLVPAYEKEAGDHVVVIRGPSMGETPEAIPNRLKRGEAADLFIMFNSALDGLIRDGKALVDTRTDLVSSGIGVAVREGAARPDISSVEAFKHAMLDASSIAISDSVSGVYVSTVLFPKLGIWDAVKDKSRMIPAEPVGSVVARGEAQIGIQQMSELKPIKGIAILGPLPEGAQKTTVFAAAVASAAKEDKAARALLHYLATSPVARAAALENGVQPLP
jgi:molybdate transport system substrate-binding protein